MSSYLSNLLTTTTGRYNSLRRTLLSSEDDGDTEDDSHISRALRAYYTEKARPFPPWLPPDPNDRRAQQYPPQQAHAQGQGYYTSAGGRSQFQAGGSNSNRGSLNDLWDPPAAASAAPAAPQSLRAGRRVAPAGARPESGSNLGVPSAARPLPSQRAGSYQSFQSTGSGRVDPSPPPSSGGGGGGGTAQERLKARLWGGARAASPAGGVSANAGGSGGGGGGGGNPYDQGYDGGGGGSGRRFGRVT